MAPSMAPRVSAAAQRHGQCAKLAAPQQGGAQEKRARHASRVVRASASSSEPKLILPEGLYCESTHTTKRRPTRTVWAGPVPIGSEHPIARQTMTTTDTKNVDATVEQVSGAASATSLRPLLPTPLSAPARISFVSQTDQPTGSLTRSSFPSSRLALPPYFPSPFRTARHGR